MRLLDWIDVLETQIETHASFRDRAIEAEGKVEKPVGWIVFISILVLVALIIAFFIET